MQPGMALGRYELVARIARGGMGEVWLATASGSAGFAKRVVVKTILPEYASNPSFVEMLTREARLCAGFAHPNLIEVFDLFEHGGVYAIAMEYIVGRSVSQILRASSAARVAVPPWAALRMIWESCRGVECAHEHGVIHCDLSPGNIMLSFAGMTKVLDFGVASAIGSRGARLTGKYHYMAPERVKSLISDRRTDVYALGVVMYTLFAGRLPIVAENDDKLLRAIVETEPQPPSAYRPIDPNVESVIMRAMARDPDARFQHAGDLLHAISHCPDGHPSACSQLDMARFLASLFRDASDLPAHARAALRDAPLHEHEVADIEISIDMLEEVLPPTATAITQTQTTAPVRALFESATRTSRSGVFDERSRDEASSSGVFDLPVARTHASTRGVFGDQPPEDDAWPWERSVIKPS
jgi:eukaryotic-like serine/threonine-protein kinase